LRACQLKVRSRQTACLIAVLSMIGLLVGCAERLSLGSSGGSTAATEPLQAAPTPPVTSAPLAVVSGPRPPPPVNMAGRWMLTSAGAPGCAMNFAGSPGAAEGSIAPEGGCPGNFFTSRRWVFEENGLVIRDHTGQPLARLVLAASGRFEGQATGGQQVALAR